MKLIIAYIQPERLTPVKDSLAAVGITRMSVTNALGCGQQQGFSESYRGARTEVLLNKKVRVEIGLRDDLVTTATDALISGARSGHPGDGMVFILDLGEAIRIRTGERDDQALAGIDPDA